MISKARSRKIGEIFCLSEYIARIRKCFSFNSFIFGSLCNFIENLIARAINNVKHFQNVQSFTWIGHAFVRAMCSGFKQIMQSIK